MDLKRATGYLSPFKSFGSRRTDLSADYFEEIFRNGLSYEVPERFCYLRDLDTHILNRDKNEISKQLLDSGKTLSQINKDLLNLGLQ